MKAIELVKMAEKFAALEENIEKGAVNWDFVGADIFMELSARGIEVDAELVEVALVAASFEEVIFKYEQRRVRNRNEG